LTSDHLKQLLSVAGLGNVASAGLQQLPQELSIDGVILEKQARRSGLRFCVVRTRISREVRVADFARG